MNLCCEVSLINYFQQQICSCICSEIKYETFLYTHLSLIVELCNIVCVCVYVRRANQPGVL